METSFYPPPPAALLSTMNIRHRGTIKQKSPEGQFAATQNETESSYNQRQKKLHTSVWTRILLIVGVFALTSAFFSRRRKPDLHVRKDSYNTTADQLNVGTKAFSANPRFVTIVMPR